MFIPKKISWGQNTFSDPYPGARFRYFWVLLFLGNFGLQASKNPLCSGMASEKLTWGPICWSKARKPQNTPQSISDCGGLRLSTNNIKVSDTIFWKLQNFRILLPFSFSILYQNQYENTEILEFSKNRVRHFYIVDNRKPPQSEMDWGVFCGFRVLDQHIGPQVSFSEAIPEQRGFFWAPEGQKMAKISTLRNFESGPLGMDRKMCSDLKNFFEDTLLAK